MYKLVIITLRNFCVSSLDKIMKANTFSYLLREVIRRSKYALQTMKIILSGSYNELINIIITNLIVKISSLFQKNKCTCTES